METLEDVPFLSGAPLGDLHLVVSRESPVASPVPREDLAGVEGSVSVDLLVET